jgi:hypothetical protein
MSETCKMKDAGQRGVCGKKAVTSFSIGPGPMCPTDYLATTMQVPVCADHANVLYKVADLGYPSRYSGFGDDGGARQDPPPGG